ncbi:MAG: methyl-accepting chemotaxis protein [Fibrobacterota bacterium]
MFNNMKIGLRLALSFCLVIVFMIAIITVSIKEMAVNQAHLDYIVNVTNVRVRLANDIIGNARETAINIRTFLLMKYSNESNENSQRLRDGLSENRRMYEKSITEIKELILKDDIKGFDLLGKIEASGDSASQIQDKVIELALAGKVHDATGTMLSIGYPTVKQWIKDNQDFIKHNEERSLFRYNEATKAQENARTAMFILGALAITLAIAIAFLLTLSITRPLKECVQAANMIASKDLTVDISTYKKRGDEVGVLIKSFGKMVGILREQMQEILEGVNTLTSSSSEIQAATTQVASGTAENASAISETTTTVEEVRQAMQLSSQKAKNVSDSAQRLEQVSKSGQKAVEETKAGMSHIREQMESIAQTIVRLSEQGQSIGGIIASVTDIADQSNLLAVNAAIEAARAGEQGKGFAVVAQEIKSLAEQSKQATTQVRTILNDVQKATSAAVMATEQGRKAVEAGVKQSAQAGEAIRVLAESSIEAVQAAMQIVASNQQQVVGMNQIGTAMENVNQAGAETAASMKQAETAARNLHELGQKLKGLVEQFKA